MSAPTRTGAPDGAFRRDNKYLPRDPTKAHWQPPLFPIYLKFSHPRIGDIPWHAMMDDIPWPSTLERPYIVWEYPGKLRHTLPNHYKALENFNFVPRKWAA